jgi:hypothetical protein
VYLSVSYRGLFRGRGGHDPSRNGHACALREYCLGAKILLNMQDMQGCTRFRLFKESLLKCNDDCSEGGRSTW